MIMIRDLDFSIEHLQVAYTCHILKSVSMAEKIIQKLIRIELNLP